MTNVAVLIPTYNRGDILWKAIAAIRHYAKGITPTFYVGNDHTDSLGCTSNDVLIFNQPTGSLGANLNRLIKNAINHGFEYIIQMDDDHILKKEVDFSPHIDALQDGTGIGWIRVMGCGAHHFTAEMKETPTKTTYWYISWDSPEVYINSNRPHIKRADWHLKFGLYPEGLKLGLTEEGFCHQCKDVARETDNPLSVAIPLTYDEYAWDHVGHSWQLEGF